MSDFSYFCTKKTKKKINKYNLYLKENFQIMKQANPHLTTLPLMKQLSTEYKKKNRRQQMIDLSDLNFYIYSDIILYFEIFLLCQIYYVLFLYSILVYVLES